VTDLRPVLLASGALVAVLVVASGVVAFLTYGMPAADAPRASTVEAVVARSAASTEAPTAFRERAVLRSCGAVALPRGGTIAAASIECLVGTPTAGRELVVVERTTEGDPLVRWYRTGPRIAGVEIFEDATADRFGGGWHRSSCRSGRIDQFGACA
jgi:hypothetical protein